jgi:hypothetical protein
MTYAYSGYPFDALESESQALTARHWDKHPTPAHDEAITALQEVFGDLLPEDFSIDYIIIAGGETSPRSQYRTDTTWIDTSEWDSELRSEIRNSEEYRLIKEGQSDKISEIITDFENSIINSEIETEGES